MHNQIDCAYRVSPHSKGNFENVFSFRFPHLLTTLILYHEFRGKSSKNSKNCKKYYQKVLKL
nr:MAG TPA: hypothetical protein [Caudoviricetes sp.]